VAVAFAPISATVIERTYSRSAYLIWQSWITALSNAVPFAVFDVFIVGTITVWVVFAVSDIRRHGTRGWGRVAVGVGARTATWAALLYLFFVASWGMNYRRVPLAVKLHSDSARVSTPAVRALAERSAARLNALHGAAHTAGWPPQAGIDSRLASALGGVERELGADRVAMPARPKRTMLDWYFRRALVDGMTDPFFLETLVASDLLPFERPFVTAHEWAHLAGYANEGEANFVSWLACMRGSDSHQYSGWLFLYSEAAGTLPRSDRTELAKRLEAGPLADLQAISARAARNVNPRVSAAGWRVYNQYLKANRVESGTASYAEVVRLILGTRFNPN
jgi:hypothetical protein